MRLLKVPVVIEEEPDGEGFAAYSPSVPGCFSNGPTLEAARQNFKSGLELHVASLVQHGEALPASGRLVRIEELSVSVPE